MYDAFFQWAPPLELALPEKASMLNSNIDNTTYGMRNLYSTQWDLSIEDMPYSTHFSAIFLLKFISVQQTSFTAVTFVEN